MLSSWSEAGQKLARSLAEGTQKLAGRVARSGTALLKPEDQNAIKSVARAVLKEFQGLSTRNAPTGSSESQGAIRRFHQTLFGQIRVLKLALMDRSGISSVDFQIEHFAYP